MMCYLRIMLFVCLISFSTLKSVALAEQNADYNADDNLFTSSVDVLNLLNVQSMQIKYLSDRIERQEKEFNELKDKPRTVYSKEIYSRGGAYADLSIAEGPCNITMRDCFDLYLNGCRQDGVYIIDPSLSGHTVRAVCDMVNDGGGWTVIQRRIDDSVNFNKNMNLYELGFGNLLGNFWLGLENIHSLIESDNDERSELYIHLEDFESHTRFAKYSQFSIADYKDDYKLDVSGYYGTAGDSMNRHNGHRFSTYDFDVDSSKTENCARNYRSGWWFLNCVDANLNGLYLEGATGKSGIRWEGWKDRFYSYKTAVMKIRRHLVHSIL